ncbi:helix-hairpin-helix domain-containing protein [Streptomyces sparsogenes]|uniref:helix-hairpin-helix domain-containing protein n=1 Tax=Streptomyces sparsogenes TaxID=67365 RepID=UPI00340B6BBF
MTAKTMHQPEADLRAKLTALAERYEEIVDRAPRHPQWLYIDPLTPGQRAEHDRAVAYRNAARAIRSILRDGQLPHDLTDTADLEQHDTDR